MVLPDGIAPATVLMKDGAINAVVPYGVELSGEFRVDDYFRAIVAPGVIDAHVHINEPGRADWEGFESATRSAAAGGVTLLVDMPLNSAPVTTTVAALQQKLAASEGKLNTDCGFYAGLVPGNTDQLEPLIDAGVLGTKAFLIHSGLDEFPAVNEADLRAAMPILARRGVPLLAHAELPEAGGPGPGSAGNAGSAGVPSSRRYVDYVASRPPDMELDAIRLLIGLCREYGCPVHIVHLATAAALPLLRAAKAEGLPITVETAPHYLFFESNEIPDGATQYKCAPPIRDAANREGLWEGLREGVIDTIGSDHSPCPSALKNLESGDFMGAWGGVASLQWLLPIVWTGAKSRGFTVEDVTRWLCRNPAQMLGLSRCQGAIAKGREANFAVWEPDESFTVADECNYHRHKTTPYAGRELYGKVHATYLRGLRIYDGEFTEPRFGRAVLGRCHHTTTS